MTLIDAAHNNVAIFYTVVVLLSLCAGSLLNVIIYRVPALMHNEWQETVRDAIEEHTALNAIPDSGPTAIAATAIAATELNSQPEFTSLYTPCCTAIAWWQYIPLLGYFSLRGECQTCKLPYSARPLAIELTTLLLSLVVAFQFGPSVQCVFALVATWFLIAMSMIDIDHHLLPDSLTLPLMWAGLLAGLLPVFADARSSIIGAAAGYLVLWFVFQLFKLSTSKDVIGYGDFALTH